MDASKSGKKRPKAYYGHKSAKKRVCSETLHVLNSLYMLLKHSNYTPCGVQLHV